MTERQIHVLKIMSDPVSHITSLTEADKAAVCAAVEEIGRLQGYKDTLNVIRTYIYERLDQHRENLRLWESGWFDPTEPDPTEREAVKRELRAAIAELEKILEDKP